MGLKTENPSRKWSLGFVEETFCPSANEIPFFSDSNKLIGSADFCGSAGGPLVSSITWSQLLSECRVAATSFILEIISV